VLDPKKKIDYFKKHWSKELQKEVKESAEEIVSYSLFIKRSQRVTHISSRNAIMRYMVREPLHPSQPRQAARKSFQSFLMSSVIVMMRDLQSLLLELHHLNLRNLGCMNSGYTLMVHIRSQMEHH